MIRFQSCQLIKKRLLRLFGDGSDPGGGALDSGGWTGKQRGARKLRRTQPRRQSKEIDWVRSGGFVVTLLPGVMFAELAKNDGTHRGALGGRIQLPVEAKALTTNITLDVLPKVRTPK
jgi:hypothetical protein